MAAKTKGLFGGSKKDKHKLRKDVMNKQNTAEIITIQSPVVSASEGLCRKLVIHQTKIMQLVEIITNSLEPGSDTKPSTYGTVVTDLLLQLDCAISITQQCLTKDVFERNTQLKDLLQDSEKVMYVNVALLVKWADFAGRDSQYCMNNEYIFFCVRAFKDALNDFVRLVAENTVSSTPNNTLSVNQKNRRASVNDALLNRVHVDIPTDPPPPSGMSNLSTPGLPSRSLSAKQPRSRVNISRDSLNSDSSDSDVTNNRRSGSGDRHEHIDGVEAPSSHGMIPNGSNHMTVAPFEQQRLVGNGMSRHSHSPASMPSTPFTNITNGVASDPDIPPPIPIKKRRQLQMAGLSSPHTSPTHSSYSSAGGYIPPVPEHSPSHSRRSEQYDDVPPPLPSKRRVKVGASTPPTHSLSSSLPHDPPPLPIRIDSIEGLRNKIIAHAPPKPPRSDQAGVGGASLPQDGNKLLQLIDQYNERIKKTQLKEGEAPPLPLKKKKAALIAPQILFASSNYTFDDSSIPLLNIPDMTAPPPLPPKKRKKRPEQVNQHDPNRRATSPALNGASPQRRKGGSVGSQDELELSSDELDPTDETVNFLEVDEVTPYLKFEQDEKGGYTLLGGPLDALIAYAGSISSSVKQYTEAFLSTYYTLICSDELIMKLLKRLHYFYKEGNIPVWQATTSLLVRVLNNMRTPLIKEAEITLIELLHTMLTDGQLKFAQLVRNAVVEKVNQKIPEFIPLSIAMCSNSKSTRVITDFDATDVAKQMTILDADYFFRVDIPEMLFWAKDHDEEKCPQLTLFTTHFNNVSQWCQTRLLERDMEWKKREKLMMYFINVMKALRELNNFNSYLAILSAIESANVSRLDWADKILRSLEEPRTLIDSRGSFKNYRQAFAQTKPPCIPYIGLYLQDLTFLEEQPTKLKDKVSINFGKRWKQFKSVDHIRFAQTKPYVLDVDPAIMGVFNGFKDHENNKDLYKRSLDIKPRPKTTQT